MMFSLGIAAYGAAKILTYATWRGLIICGVGLWAAGMVRPHMAALVAVSLAAAVITRKSKTELRELAPIVKGGAIVIVAVLAAVLVVRTDRFLQDRGSIPAVGSTPRSVMSRAERPKGGRRSSPRSWIPRRGPRSRPSPCCSAPSSSRPTTCRGSWRRSRGPRCWSSVWLGSAGDGRRSRSLRRQPYVVFCFVYTVLFIVAYSSYANFGLLARQRVQLYPLFLVLLSIPPFPRRSSTTATLAERSELEVLS